ncbi:hypothetical protein ABZ357_19595 [Streptomyces sp. NPDC005917]|uniref:hypothetical protein n=1 Tax=unclassified Streptomyces TaxID=2593676 RepID=UPI0033D0D702
MGHFTVKFTEVDVGDVVVGEPQTYVLARVTSHSCDTAIYEQRGIVVSLIKPSGALDVRTTLCVELAGDTYGDYDTTQGGGSPDRSGIRVTLSPTGRQTMVNSGRQGGPEMAPWYLLPLVRPNTRPKAL